MGAPVGSVLCGNREFIKRAHRFRKMAGGGMRQAGSLAAAGIYALDQHVNRLEDDHVLARKLAEGLALVPMLQIEIPQTNIVFVDLVGSAEGRSQELIVYLRDQGVLVSGTPRLRFVTHLDIDAAAVDTTVRAVRKFFEG